MMIISFYIAQAFLQKHIQFLNESQLNSGNIHSWRIINVNVLKMYNIENHKWEFKTYKALIIIRLWSHRKHLYRVNEVFSKTYEWYLKTPNSNNPLMHDFNLKWIYFSEEDINIRRYVYNHLIYSNQKFSLNISMYSSQWHNN